LEYSEDRPKSSLEKDLYWRVKAVLETMFSEKFGFCYLETTSEGTFSDSLKDQVQHDIIFSFIRKTRGGGHVSPDLTGYVRHNGGKDFITVEVKNEKLILDDVYQAKMYADLFSAKYGLLISTDPVPSELKKLHIAIHVLDRSVPDCMYLAQCSNLGLIEPTSWFPVDPLGVGKPEHLVQHLIVQKVVYKRGDRTLGYSDSGSVTLLNAGIDDVEITAYKLDDRERTVLGSPMRISPGSQQDFHVFLDRGFRKNKPHNLLLWTKRDVCLKLAILFTSYS